jgi:glycosyltransferase involved in cell wall biosynthesis
MKDPLISIVVPAYNYGRYLDDCIGGLLSQTYSNWELVVVDNGSTDDTPWVLTRYSDPRIRKFRIEQNRGPVEAWKLGYRESRGDYFAILPADDMFLPEKLQRQVDFLRDHPDVGAVGTYIQQIDDQRVVCNEGSWIVPYINQPIDFADPKNWRWKHYLCIPTALYSMDLIRKAGAIPSDGLSNMCDWDFHIRLLGAGTRMTVIPEVLTSYRWHGSNTSLNQGRTFLQWTYSHAKNYVPILRKISPDPSAEIRACIEALCLATEQNYVDHPEDTPEPLLCVIMEVLLDPSANLGSFEDYEQFERFAKAWAVDSENRVAQASVVGSLRELRHRLLFPLETAEGMPPRGGLFPLEAALLEARSELGRTGDPVEDLTVAHDSLRWAIVHVVKTARRAMVRCISAVLKKLGQ